MILKEELKKNLFVLYIYDKLKEFYYKYLISDEKLIKRTFKKRLGREVNLVNPIKYNDKLQWLKLYWRDPLATKCADKYKVREYVKQTIGEQYLNELYGVYESVDEIDLNKLPKSFVLKGTHGSGFNIICKDKDQMDWNKEFKKMKRWLWTNYYWSKREWVYKDIKPRIICERYLEEEETGELRDYKIYCFYGEPKLIQVDIERFGNHKQNFYDINWRFLDIQIHVQNDKNINIPKPDNFEEMIEISQKLSKRFPHVRVDLYNVDGKIVFGELTFFHMSGFVPFKTKELEDKMGEWIKLPNKL